MKNERLISVGLWVISGLLGVLISLIMVIWSDHNKRQDEDKQRQEIQLNETRRLLASITEDVKGNKCSIDEIRKYILIRDGVDVEKIDFNDLVDKLRTQAAGEKKTIRPDEVLSDYLVENVRGKQINTFE